MVSVSTIFSLIFLCLSVILFIGLVTHDQEDKNYNLYLGGIIICIVAADILASTSKKTWTSYDITGIIISFLGLVTFVIAFKLESEEYGKLLIGCSLLTTVLGSSLLVQEDL